jgi:anti-sigma regulatory factor (Ser/Thr protein kinase)
MALGILDDEEFDTACDTVHLSHGEQLIIVSDGLIEVFDSNNDMLMEDGISDIIKDKLLNSETITAQSLYEKALQFNVSDSFDDDVSAIIFSAKPIQLLPSVKNQFGLPSSHEVALTAELLKQPDILQRVLQIAGQCEGVQSIRSVLYTVLSELFNNALEHGVLKLDSEIKSTTEGFHSYYEMREASLKELSDASITIRIESLPNEQKIQVSVLDSGDGFSWDSLQNVTNDESFGRGLAMVHALCEQVRFEEGGRKVIGTLSTNPH